MFTWHLFKSMIWHCRVEAGSALNFSFPNSMPWCKKSLVCKNALTTLFRWSIRDVEETVVVRLLWRLVNEETVSLMWLGREWLLNAVETDSSPCPANGFLFLGRLGIKCANVCQVFRVWFNDTNKYKIKYITYMRCIILQHTPTTRICWPGSNVAKQNMSAQVPSPNADTVAKRNHKKTTRCAPYTGKRGKTKIGPLQTGSYIFSFLELVFFSELLPTKNNLTSSRHVPLSWGWRFIWSIARLWPDHHGLPNIYPFEKHHCHVEPLM